MHIHAYACTCMHSVLPTFCINHAKMKILRLVFGMKHLFQWFNVSFSKAELPILPNGQFSNDKMANFIMSKCNID
jgi:hypothetical protein